MSDDAPADDPSAEPAPTPAEPAPKGAWLWPLRFPQGASRIVWSWAQLGDRCFTGWGWLPAALLIGTVPLLIAFPFASSCHQVASALLLFVLFLSAVRVDATGKGVAAIGVAYVGHCAVAITLASQWPELAQGAFPDGLAYWQEQQNWIAGGYDRGYDPNHWVWAHGQIFLAMVAFGYLSAGAIPFVRGFYEVDLMNYYVGQLVAGSQSGATAVGFGWHLWSIMRGVCYAVLVFEVASLSLERATGRTLSTPTRRKLRWAVAIGFFFLDCVLKYLMLEPVRGTLEANLDH